MLQQPLNSRDGFRPGTGFNLNAGFRYVGIEHVTPSLQINAREIHNLLSRATSEHVLVDLEIA